MKIPRLGKAKYNIITTLLNQLITTACGIIIPHILISSFGSETYGITVSITQFLSYITLLEGGIGGVARARLYGPLARKDNSEISAVYNAVKRFFQYVAIAFVIYSAVLGLVYHDIAHVSIFSRAYIFALVIVISLSTLAKYMGGLANLTLIVADQRQYINNLITAATTVANTIAIIVLVNMKTDIIWVKLGSSLIFIVRPLLYSLYVKKHYVLPKTEKGKAVLDQKWTGIGQHIAYFLHTNTDVVLLTLFANARLIAVYSVYHLLINSIRAITEAFSGGMEAAFGEMIAKGQLAKLQRSYGRYKALLTSVSVVMFCCTGVLVVPFIKLYTKGITDADYTQPLFALIMLLAEAVNCMILPCASLPVAANRLKQTRWGAYGEAIINIALSCILIQWDPLLGVAIGTLAATVFRGVFYMFYSSKHLLHMPFYKLILRFVGTIAVLLSLILLGRFLLQYVTIENYFQWILCGAAVFAAVGIPTALYLVIRSKRSGPECEAE